MNLNATIHTMWAEDETLNGLLDASKLHTGIYFGDDPTFPYATLTRPGDQPLAWDNANSGITSALVRLTVYHGRDNYDEGLAIADAVKACFNRQDFALSGTDHVMNMQLSGYQEIEDDEGAWYFVLDFTCLIYLSSGV